MLLQWEMSQEGILDNINNPCCSLYTGAYVGSFSSFAIFKKKKSSSLLLCVGPIFLCAVPYILTGASHTLFSTINHGLLSLGRCQRMWRYKLLLSGRWLYKHPGLLQVLLPAWIWTLEWNLVWWYDDESFFQTHLHPLQLSHVITIRSEKKWLCGMGVGWGGISIPDMVHI